MGENGNSSQAILTYWHEGELYTARISATSWDDAEARLASIKRSGRVQGWPCYSYRANSLTLPIIHVWVNIKAWWLNFREKTRG
jgi:hypothetical protein